MNGRFIVGFTYAILGDIKFDVSSYVVTNVNWVLRKC